MGISGGAFYNLLIGCMAFFVIKYQKLIYVSPLGMVRETHTWLTSHRELLRWDEVKFITIMYRGASAIVFLERDAMGWKVLFGKEQIPALKELFEEYLPDAEVNEIGGQVF